MKRIDSLKISLAKAYEGIKAALTDEELQIDLVEDTLSDGKKIEYSAFEVGAEVFVMSDEEGVEPTLLEDGEYTLEDGPVIVIAEGKISEITPKEEEEAEETTEEVELSEEQKKLIALAVNVSAEDLEKLVDLKKDGFYTITMSVMNGKVIWADMYTERYETLLSDQVDPIKVKLEAEQKKVTDLEAKVVLLQELNDQRNPLEKGIKLEAEKPLTRIEQIKENIKLAQTIKD